MPSALNTVYSASFILVTEFTSNICLLILSCILKLSESLQTFETKLTTASLWFSLHGSLVATLQANTVTLPHTSFNFTTAFGCVSRACERKQTNSSRKWLSCATSTYPNHVYSNHSNNINIVMRSCTHILDRFTMIYISVILQCKYCIGRNCLLGTTPSRTLGITKTCTGAWWWQNRSPFLCEHWTRLLQMLL